MNSFQALTISIIFHVVLVFVLSHSHTPVKKSDYQPIEIKYEDSARKKQMVESTDVPIDKLLQVKPEEKKADFFSEKTVRVKQETKAAVNGITRNAGSRGKQVKRQDRTEEGNQQVIRETQQTWTPGLSASDDALPSEMKVGDFTVLNTDAHLFYTFFARIKDQIRFRWVRQVENSIESLRIRDIHSQTQSTWNTQIEVVLDRHGNYLSSAVMKPSGMPSFDKAALVAFKEGAPFPNPPREMIKEDGKIYLDYAFQVYWNPQELSFRRQF